ncbi:MAG: putative Ig domain-containing protein [Thermoplasmata archaeon]|nr:MAG: putative Ig domain-containing protein [Thermoplasmata archaeon]
MTLVLSNVVILPIYQQVQAKEHLIEENDEEGVGQGLAIYSNYRLAQCFNATSNYTLKRVSLFVNDEGSMESTLGVQIYDNDDKSDGISDNDVPNSSISPMVGNNGPNNEFTWLDFKYSVPLTEGERYWIVADCGGPEGDGYRWKDSENDSYSGGYIAKEGNPDWILDTSNDLMFRVFGEYDNDVGVEEIIAPELQELYLEANVTAIIMNYGVSSQSGFDVRCTILAPNGSEILNDTETIDTLGSDKMTGLTWFFTPVVEGVYAITVTTLLEGDEYNINNAISMNMNVQKMAVLKLHAPIEVTDNYGNWHGDKVPTNDTWHTSRREFIWNDTVGDDNGDGDYTYPNSTQFEAGCLDITEFRVAVDYNRLNFRIEFGSIDDGVGDGSDGWLGFSEQIIEILIDTDRDGTGRDDTIRNARLKLDKSIGWEYALWVNGWNDGYILDESGNMPFGVLAQGSPETNAVQISLPLSNGFSPDFEVWRYVVLVGAHHNKSLPFNVHGSRCGFMRVDSQNSTVSGGGGEDKNGADSNVYDMVFASLQSSQLDDYGSEDILLTEFTDTMGMSGSDISSSEWWAQSFTAPFTCLLSSVDIFAKDVAPDSIMMGITIYDNNDMDNFNPDDDLPGWTWLSSINGTDFGTEYEWKNVEFSNPPVIRGGETYWIVAKSMDESGKGYKWGKNQNTPWGGGHSASWHGSDWQLEDGDMLFRAYFRKLTTIDAHQPIYFAPIVINEIYVNGSADKEWINILYDGTDYAPPYLDMNNWTLTDQDGNIFQFEDFTLYNYDSVTVHSGFGADSETDLFWGKSVGVWDDFGDDVLLNSNFIVPVDFMNYTDGNEFGNDPPVGMNWGPEDNENLPINPHRLQKLSLKVEGGDYDFYRDWEFVALGNVQDKTLYFFDDGTFDSQDPHDFMNTTPPIKVEVLDFDGDGNPGLTLNKSAPPTDPQRYQEFNLTPVLAMDFKIVDNVLIDLWFFDYETGGKEALKVTLYDCNTTIKKEIANETISFILEDSAQWSLINIIIFDLDYTLRSGHYLTFRVMIDSSSENDLVLAYNSTEVPSCIRTIPTRTFVNVDWAKTYNTLGQESTSFSIGEDVIIKANVSDPLGSYDIFGAYISITPPGAGLEGAEKPMTLKITDPSNPSAWKLFNYTYKNANKAGEYTVRIKGIESNGVIHTITIYFYILRNEKPQLTNKSLIPSSGLASTSFNFTINYTDLENHPPGIVTVNITGRGTFKMDPLDPDDDNYTDGNLYFINLTGFVNGTSYSYHFAANDSKGLWNYTDPFNGPYVYNTPPVLSDWGLDPPEGYASTGFNFTVKYTDIDNQTGVVKVNITGSSPHAGSYEMLEVDPYDTNRTDGKLYYFNYTGFYNGSYKHQFAACDSQTWVNTSELSGPHVMNTPPYFRKGKVLPIEGYITTEFKYSVFYFDLDNQAPGNITVNISGPWHAGSWKMIEKDTLDEYYVDGKEYYYTYTGLKIGSYSFHIWANDSQGLGANTSERDEPIIHNTRPTLSGHNLNPKAGDVGAYFNYTVIYTDLDNQTAGNITVNITGPSYAENLTMNAFDPLDTNYTDGKFYYLNITLSNEGTYNYTIYANDSDGLWAIPIFDSGPNVGSDAPPLLTQPMVNPETGFTTTWFNFTVNFTDFQNDSADVILLNLSGPSGGLFTMFEVDTSDMTTEDGKYFYRNITWLEKGIYSFYVEGNDTNGNSTQSAERYVPLVKNTPHELLGSCINQSEYGGSWFNFSLVYVDTDNDPAGSVNINISGVGNVTMLELDPSDVIFSDGKEYYYNTTFSKGSYSYRFEANDTGFNRVWNYTTFEDFTLINNIPIFLLQDVTPPTGFGGEYFNFTVTVLDFDGDTLEVLLHIQGDPASPYTMLEADMADTDTTDGKIYFYNLSFERGSYNYTFSVYDGEEPNQTSPLTLIVKNNPPAITTSDITSTDEDDLYSVDYDNIDLDGDIVTWILDTNATWLNIDSDTGVLEGTPTNLEVGSYYVNVSVDDGFGGIDFHNFTLYVINTLPQFTTIPDEYAQEDFLHLDDFNCIDDGQGNIVYSLLTNASRLSLHPVTGLLSGTPDNTNVGSYWVKVSVDDGNGGIVSVNYTLWVNNTPPTITTDPDQVAIEDSLHLNDFTCDDDGEGDITYSLETNATWLNLNPSTGILSGIPNNTHVGSYWVNVSVDDGNGGKDFVNYSLSVLNVQPIITITPDVTAQEDFLHSDNFDCTDEGQGNIIYSLTTDATWLMINPSTGLLNGTPNNTHVGFYFVNVTVNDGNGGIDNINYTITVINTLPTITTIPIPVVTQDIPYHDDIDCNDDGQGTIIYSIATNATWFFFNSTTGELNGTPNNTHLGSYWVNVSVTDGNGGMDFINYSLTVDDVNDPPIITTTNIEFVDEDSLYSVDYEYIDIDDPVMTWSLYTNSSWLDIDTSTGVLSGIPQNDDVGSCWVNVTVNDGRGGTDYTNFTITVSNTPPSIINTPIEFTDEDDFHLDDFNCDDDFQGNIVYSFITNATWLNIDSLTGIISGTSNNTLVGWYWVNVSVEDGNGGRDSRNYTLTVYNTLPLITTTPEEEAFEDTLHADYFMCIDDDQGNIVYSMKTNATWLGFVADKGILSGTPYNTEVGWYWVNVTVNDGNGGVDSLNYTLTVHNVHPNITTIPDATASEDILHLDNFDCDDDGQGNIIYSLASNATWLNIDPISGVVNVVPINLYVGEYFVNVSVSDGNGGIDFVNYSLTVFNTQPHITNTPDDFAIEDMLHIDDFNCDDDGQGNITYYLVTNATWLNIDPVEGILSGTPDNSHVGWFWINVSVNDGNGGIDYRNYTLNVSDVNDPPVITTIDLEFALEDSLYYVDYEYIDVDDTAVSWYRDSNASWLTINSQTGELSGIPENHEVGWCWVNVTVDDGRGGIAFSNFTITVNNTPPAITNTPIELVDEDLTFLDDFNSNDDDQGNIIYSMDTNATWFDIDNISGVLSGLPNNNHVGWYWINVTVSDGNGGIDWRNYTITVNNTVPLITTLPTPISYEDYQYLVDFNCNDDGQGVIIYYLNTNGTWLSIDDITGTVIGTPVNNDVGSYWINVTVMDGNSGMHSVNYTLTVNNTNDAPIITTGNLEFVDEDSLYLVDYDYFDIDGDMVSWSRSTNASWLSINESNGVLSGSPRNADVGWYWVNIVVDDGNGGYNSTYFIIHVNNTNDKPSIPVLSYPQDDSVVNTTYPDFIWDASIDPDRGDYIVDYTLEYSTSSAFTENITVVTAIVDTSYVPEIELMDKTWYYWRVEAFDSLGVGSGYQTPYFAFFVDIGYKEPRYKGTLKSAQVKFGGTWSVDLDDHFILGSITEGLSFTSNYGEIQIDPKTHVATWKPKTKDDVLTDVVFTMSDGKVDISSNPIDISVEQEKTSLSFLERIYWPYPLIPMIFFILLGCAFAVKRYKERPVVEEVFFISENGRLIAHASVKVDEEIDEDILSSMLTGVKDFVSDAFIRDESMREEKGLQKLEFGEETIYLERGEHFFIALIFTGRGIPPKLKAVKEEIEKRFGDVLEDWDGDMRAFEGAHEIISWLLPLEKMTEEQKKKLKEGKGKDKVLEKWENIDEEFAEVDISMEELRKEMGWK